VGVGNIPMDRILPKESFADRVQELIKKFGSQEKLGDACGISGVTIGKYALGKAEPSRERLIAMAKAAGCNIAWLTAGEGFKDREKLTYPMADGLKTADLGGELAEGFVQIPRYEVKASAGGGAMIHSEQIVDHLSFKADWVRNALNVPVNDLALINVTGDSMEPTLSEGDLILVDMSHHGVKDNAIYVLQLNGALLVKRIQHKLDGSVIVKSDNLIYEPERIGVEAVDSLNVIGRVVWCGRRM
jgi:phage repressor protein C with HTH and peptisase S24 domain